MRVVLLKILKFVATAALEKFLTSKESGLSKLILAEARIEADKCVKQEKLRKQYQTLEAHLEEKAERKASKAIAKRAKLEQL